ncbi:hypothetical protein [Cellulomonas oligotrophica]|uniref:DUF222 domain-containing protein n=1 Tax=Cellulomonas oligotrophica TaxID=931536 RepID=A0A7Y9FDC2_9CELL|nr:hypothetical protein [Cellulomonas oligotrophica]NYD85298.1 hypothetical protein [Cellulomonas oligotrophica]GIG33266.1 hypothetical protein Col01nite_24250 [Cellulomonas oligotrophica]
MLTPVPEASDGTAAEVAAADRALRRAVHLERLAALRALPAPARAALALRHAHGGPDMSRDAPRTDAVPGQREGGTSAVR